jgi:pyruvate/2-oxoglutarate dehydrogenase complex dihydrolipoamide dehydrogenase (E3) component
MKQYDIAVIGAGSAGLVAALTANRRGAKVAMIEKDKIGGDCTHTGCVPSKTILHAARVFHEMKHTESLGLPRVNTTTDFEFAKVMEHVDSVVQGIYAHEKPEIFQDMGIDVFVHRSGAKFLNNKGIQMGDEIIYAEYTIICTGSSPRMVTIEGHRREDILTTDNFWQIRERPAPIVFLGGGVIAAEIGQAMARFGCEVTIIDRHPRILKVVDEEVGDVAIQTLKEEGIHILTDSEITLCELRADGKNIIYIEQKGEETQLETEGALFAALGRVPNVGGMELEQAGVEYDAKGIKTNEYLQTTADNIYAAGDVTTPYKFTHTASYQARVCIANILHGNHVVNDLSVLPWGIFMDPEIGHVGMSEAQAREAYDNVRVFKVGAGTVDRFITEGKTTGFMKVVMDENDNILGADAIGAEASEWIQFITVAMKNRLPITAFTDMIFAYPTFSEIVQKAFSRYLRTKIK